MWLAYLIALLPFILGAVFFAISTKIAWWEWALSGAIGLVLAGTFHYVAIHTMTGDTETWSGRAVEVVHYPRWIEEYQESHTRSVPNGTDNKGNTTYRTETYYTTEHRTHPEYWERRDDFGKIDRSPTIDKGEYDDLARQFGGQVDTEKPHKSGFDGGDPNVYHVRNRTGIIIPLTMVQRWENRVKAAPSCFSYSKVPDTVKVFPWPENPNTRISDRVMGIARNRFTTMKWDQMCARLGPTSRVNLIVVGFDSDDSGLGQWQEAKWIGGKKNDLVLCYGTAQRGSKATWTYIFGWTEREDVKKNLQTLLLTNELKDDLLPLIEAEVAKNYRLKDWTKFDYLRVEPPTWAYLVLLGAMVVVQGIVWTWAFFNDAGKIRDRLAWKKGSCW